MSDKPVEETHEPVIFRKSMLRFLPLKTVCLIVKAPRIGEVKTRLAGDIGTELATTIYRVLIEHQAAAMPPEWQVSVYFTPSDAEEETKCWLKPHLPNGADFVPQAEGDLGRRVAMAMRREFARGAGRIFLIGGDCAGLSLDYLRRADTALDRSDVVIGPAQDGAYVLLGLKRPLDRLGASPLDRLEAGALDRLEASPMDRPEAGALDRLEAGALDWLEAGPLDPLFEEIARSSSLVLEQTLDVARNHNLSVHLLRPLTDIDDIASLKFELVQSAFEKREDSIWRALREVLLRAREN